MHPTGCGGSILCDSQAMVGTGARGIGVALKALPEEKAVMQSLGVLLRLLPVLVMALAGCATNPYVAIPRPDVPASASAGIRVQAAVEYANRVYDAYAKMPLDEFERQQALSTGLILAGASVLGMAIGGASTNAIAGVALAGGTAYTIGNWNTSASRQMIFIEGRKALSCGRSAVAPLDLSDEELDLLRQQVKATVEVARRAARAAGDVTRWLAIVSSQDAGAASPLVTASQAELAAFAQRFDAANKVILHAGGAERLVASAGGLLVAHVDNVRTLVDGSLNDTQASLLALPQAIGTLGKAAAMFVPTLDLDSTLKNKVAAPKSGAGGVVTAEDGCIDASTGAPVPCAPTSRDPVAQLSEALGRLRYQAAALEVQTNALRAVDPMALEQMQAAITACNPDLAKAMRPLTADPATIEVEAGTPAAALVVISGGTAPYTPTVLSPGMPGVNIVVLPDAITITTGMDTVAGSTYRIRIVDSARASVTVTIKVSAKPAPVAPEITDKSEQRSGTKKAGVQSPKTAPKVAPAPAPADKAAASCVPIPDGKVCEVAGAQCEFECGLSKAQLANLRERLGLPRVPERFDVELRERMLQAQKKSGLPPTGQYDEDTAKAINQ